VLRRRHDRRQTRTRNCAFLNGRLEDPAILAGGHDRAEPVEPDKAKCLAWWDFGAEISTDRIIDRGPQGLHGHVRNLPMRAVRGSRWIGEETNWRHMPRHYAAIHFPMSRAAGFVPKLSRGLRQLCFVPLLTAAIAIGAIRGTAAQSENDTFMAGRGKVSFAVSCDANLQPRFDAALAALHSFRYGQALKEFTAITEPAPTAR
jgi:hypothetical protein